MFQGKGHIAGFSLCGLADRPDAKFVIPIHRNAQNHGSLPVCCGFKLVPYLFSVNTVRVWDDTAL